MSLIRAIKHTLGLSVTPANNFTFDASADNGTMKLARGNAGATTQDIMTVAADGKVAFPQQGQSLTQNGYAKLPGGLIIQWGYTITSSAATTPISFPIPFPSSLLSVAITPVSTNDNAASIQDLSSSGISLNAYTQSGARAAIEVKYIAIGY